MGKKKGKGAAAKAATPPAAAAAGAPPPIAPPARAAAALSLALAAAAPAGRGAASAADVAIKLAGGNNAGPRTRSTSDEAAFGSPRSADAAAAMFQGSAGVSSPSPSRLLSKSNAYFAEPVLEARLVRFYLRHRLTPGAGKSAGELAAKWKDSQDALELGLLQRYGEGLRENIWLESGRQARAAQAFAAVLAICLMLVLAHFATRPNGMIGPPREFCTSTTAKPSASDPCHFSDSYWEARARFRRTATAAGLELESKAVLRGTDYTIDFAVANPHAAAAGGPLVVHISGVGGVEGYAGSAIQAALLQVADNGQTELAEPPLEADMSERRQWTSLRNALRGNSTTVVFVHAFNPYGFAHDRRWNENNVDLSLNGMGATERLHVLKRDPNVAGYFDLDGLFNPTSAPSIWDPVLLLVRSLLPWLTHGRQAITRALEVGQYTKGTGVFYGGRDLQESFFVLSEYLYRPARNWKRASSVVVVDVHTGPARGHSGADDLRLEDCDRSQGGAHKAPGTAVDRRGVYEHVFGNHDRFSPPVTTIYDDEWSAAALASSGQIFCVGTDDPSRIDASLSELKQGSLGRYMRTVIFPELEASGNFFYVAQSFGTVAPIMVARALILESAAFQHNPHSHSYWAQYSRDAFYVRNNRWRRAVLTRGLRVFNQAVRAKHASIAKSQLGLDEDVEDLRPNGGVGGLPCKAGWSGEVCNIKLRAEHANQPPPKRSNERKRSQEPESEIANMDGNLRKSLLVEVQDEAEVDALADESYKSKFAAIRARVLNGSKPGAVKAKPKAKPAAEPKAKPATEPKAKPATACREGWTGESCDVPVNAAGMETKPSPCRAGWSSENCDVPDSKPAKLVIKVVSKPADCKEVSKYGDALSMHYTGAIAAGSATGVPGLEFDSSRATGRLPFDFALGKGEVIDGWDQGLSGMCVGEKRELTIPSALGYGETGSPPDIPAGATLHFAVELLSLTKPPNLVDDVAYKAKFAAIRAKFAGGLRVPPKPRPPPPPPPPSKPKCQDELKKSFPTASDDELAQMCADAD